jgi:hypothetical protein
MKTKTMKLVLIANQGRGMSKPNKGNQPPKNKMEVIEDIKMM